MNLPSISPRRLLRLATLAMALLPTVPCHADDNEQMWQAVKRRDARALRMILPTASTTVTDSTGKTPLMVAAGLGSFECCRELLWAGADPLAKSREGKTAREYLRPGVKGYVPLDLLIRCHAFTRGQGVVQQKAGVGHRVIINDAYVDHANPTLRPRYYSNAREASGKPNVDDDGNGFVDDVWGWNITDNVPIQVPDLLGGVAEVQRVWLERLVTDFEDINRQTPGFESIRDRLSKRYENPIIKRMGFALADSAGLKINDLAYAGLFVSASHGTHVGGIVLTASNGTAELHGVAWGQFNDVSNEEVQGIGGLLPLAQRLAPESATYTDFIASLRKQLLEDARRSGQRFSSYIKSTQCGIVNMSWGKNLKYFRALAGELHDIYEAEGEDPETIEDFNCPVGMDLCDDLALELLAADTAALAIVMAQNPDVLFVMAAGNEAANNDKDLPSPSYLSRFFPNALSVASVDRFSRISAFSNSGMRSVQVAASGEMILSDLLGGVKGRMSGTSMAAPMVAGAAAAIRAKYPNLNAPTVRRILLASAGRTSDLTGRVSTGAVLDGPAALELAGAWQSGYGRLIDESWDWPPGDDEAPVIGRKGGSEGSAGSGGGAPSIPLNVTAMGGFAETNWVMAMTEAKTQLSQQVIQTKEFPMEWVKERYADDLRITSIAGDADGWAVAMSPGGFEQNLVGFGFDQTTLKARMDEGYRIACMSGWNSQWVFVLDKSKGYGNQRYTLPGDFSEERKGWIVKRWNEGYRITSVAGAAGPDDKNSWVVVMSENSGINHQIYSGPGPWPSAFIAEYSAKGYAMSSVTGFGEKWVVVMSQMSAPVKQRISQVGVFPHQWLRQQWGIAPEREEQSVPASTTQAVKSD